MRKYGKSPKVLSVLYSGTIANIHVQFCPTKFGFDFEENTSLFFEVRFFGLFWTKLE